MKIVLDFLAGRVGFLIKSAQRAVSLQPPMQYSASHDRMNNCPSETAGVALIRSPRSLVASNFQPVGSGAKTNVLPCWLVAYRRSGVEIREDNGAIHRTAPAQVHRLRRVGTNCWLELRIHEGRKRQVRRMLAAVGLWVLQLQRVGVGPLRLGDLGEGKWRYLSADEVEAFT